MDGKVGRPVPVFVRFSTVAGELGSADTRPEILGQVPFKTESGIEAFTDAEASYNKDGQMRYRHNGDQPVYAPNSFGGPAADPESYREPAPVGR